MSSRGERGPCFSFVIPTMQRSPLLEPLLADLAAHPLVGEVIVINNVEKPLVTDLPKVQVVNQGHNLFVNPSWNLGVSLSRFPYVALCNDDISFPGQILGPVATALRFPVGLVGPSNVCFKDIWQGRTQPAFRVVFDRPSGYGTLLFTRRAGYRPIPEDMLIWFGDDWLFATQKRWNLAFHGVHIATPMSVTSSSAEFSGRYALDQAAYERLKPATGTDLAFSSRAFLATTNALRFGVRGLRAGLAAIRQTRSTIRRRRHL